MPTWVKGIFLRWPRMVAFAERRQLDRKAVRLLQKFRRKYGETALIIAKPGRRQILLLSAADVQQILDGAPEPFTPASSEKRIALSHFEPRTSLITRGASRDTRRAFHDRILESNTPVHCKAQVFVQIVEEEAAALLDQPSAKRALSWPVFTEAWHRSVRRVVLGDGARDDIELTTMLARLRNRANWLFVPVAKRLRQNFHARVSHYLARGEPGSLAELVRDSDAARHPSNQVAQWLFAFDAGGITLWRTLALLAAHVHQLHTALAEARNQGPYLRACFSEAVRLWPTTPVILREATMDSTIGSGRVPAGSGLIIYTPFFHRDTERLAGADRFCPDIWLGKDPAEMLPLMPFSAGPAACPGRHLVTLLGSAWLAALLSRGTPVFTSRHSLDPDRPLPGTLDHTALKFRLHLP
jgi:cytochrome P450